MNDMVILISGNGSNMVALAKAAQTLNWAQRFDARIRAVISNRPHCGGIAKALELGLNTEVLDHQEFRDHPQARESFDAELARRVKAHRPRWVLLAGFMRILTPVFLDQFKGAVINIHPSLLPAFTGLNTHERAIAAGCRFAGATVHWVNAELDAGHLIDQVVVPILPHDHAQDLAQRVLSQEHVLYPRAMERVFKGEARA